MLLHRILISILCFSLIITSIYLTHYACNQIIPTTTKPFVYPVIVIDAGHGGIDSGTSGNDGTPEKTINLLISQKLNDTLTLMGYQTQMTRTKDELIGEGEHKTIRSTKQADIAKRLQIVENQDNCLLISIHQNFFNQSQYKGFQVFYNNNHPQNKVLAQTLQKVVKNQLQPENNREIKTIGAEIYLLNHCTKPAVMIECGFMSNPKELSLLKNQSYQKKIVYSIAKGLDEFIQQNTNIV